jgi:protein O-GlcNAc transferase
MILRRLLWQIMGDGSWTQSLQEAIRLHNAGQLIEAERLYRRVLEIESTQVDALHRLGFLLHQLGKSDEGLVLIRRSLERAPNHAPFFNNYGEALRAVGKLDEAIAAYQKSLALSENNPFAHNNLGAALAGKGQYAAALPHLKRALQLRPNYPNALMNLGSCLQQLGQANEALTAMRKAIELEPANLSHWNNLALLCKQLGRTDEVIACCHKTTQLQPADADAWGNLASFLKDQGRIHEALPCLRRASELRPMDSHAASRYLQLLPYDPAQSMDFIRAELRKWDAQHAAPLRPQIERWNHDRSPNRKLRIGYVSPDFREHSLGRLLDPVFTHHHQTQFELICYSDVEKPDAFTDRFRAQSALFRDTRQTNDAQLSEQIRSDQIDILIDLSAHMAKNRLLVFARRSAPVQISYLAYPFTTGLSTMDWLVTDRYLDPPLGTGHNHIERLLYLPHSYWCYSPPPSSPELTPLPAQSKGFITFGSLNNFVKMNPQVWRLWAAILNSVPSSRLALLIRGSRTGNESVLKNLAACGLDPARVDLHPQCSPADYFRLYHEIDIALDPFPVDGHTTTLDALWMGVPVVTLAGANAMGRGAGSILTSIGHTDLIADTPDAYTSKAVALAHDLPGCAQLRHNLRQSLQSSPIMNAPQFAADLESAYRLAWRAWCDHAF